MKKIIIAVAAVVLATNLGMAQPGGGGRGGQRMSPEERQKMMQEQQQKRSAELKEALSLTDDASSKVDSANAKYDRLQLELFKPENRGGDRDARRTQMENIQKARETEVRSLLTPEQVKKYDQWLKDQQKERQNRRGEGPRGGGQPQGGSM